MVPNIRRHPEAGGEPQVVVLAVAQAAGQRIVLFHQRPGACSGLGRPDQGGGAEQADWAASAAGSTASRPWLIASLASCCIRVSASAACVARHHWPGPEPARRPGPHLLQRGQRIGQLTAQRCHQPGQHLRRRRPLITGHTGTLPARECSPHAFPVTGRTSLTCTATPSEPMPQQRPPGDSIFPGANRLAILDPLRHR